MTRYGRHGVPLPHRYPWLLYQHGEDYTNKTFRTIGPESAKQQYSRRCKSPQLRGKFVIESFKGWLLLQKEFDDDDWLTPGGSSYYKFCILWNPSTFESIDLAPLEFEKSFKVDCYLLHEEDVDGKKMLNLLLFEKTMPCIFRCRCLRDGGGGGGGHWEAIRYRKQIEAFYEEYDGGYDHKYPLRLDDPFFCNGKLYALTHTQRLVEIEIQTKDNDVEVEIKTDTYSVDDDDDDLSSSTNKNGLNHGLISIKWLDCRLPSCLLRSFCSQSFLVESKGEIFNIIFELGAVFQGDISSKEPLAIHVFKLSFFDMTWIKLDSFKDKVFFLCIRSNCFSLDVGEGERGNCIYFIKAHDNFLYCYNMEDDSISAMLPCPRLPTPWLSPIWVMPDVVSFTNNGDNNSKNVDVDVDVVSLKNVDIEKQEEILTTHVSDLGLDLLNFIAKKLVCFDYMSFRESCKLFRSAAHLNWWRKVLPDAEMVTRNCLSRTCLVIHGNKDIWCFVDPHVVGHKYMMTFPEPELLEDVTVQCSKGGWLLLSCSGEPKTIFFFNPFTKAVIRLPKLETRDPQAGFTFSSLPNRDDCATVSIAFACRVCINLFFEGEANWETVEFDSGYPKFMPSFNNPVFWNGAVYFLGQTGNLGVLTIDRKGIHDWQLLDNPKSPCKYFHQNFLVECGGELMSVFVGYKGRRVEVFKLSSSKLVWEKVDTLGNYVLFISRSSSYSTLAKSEGTENRIYFPRLCDKNPVYYSLDTGKFHLVGSNDSLLDFGGTVELLACGWIEPRWC